jgi:hypothetical protein
MTKAEFDQTAFYCGIRAELALGVYGATKILPVQSVDFDTGDTWVVETDGRTVRYKLQYVLSFEPPLDYCPCYECGLKHHPRENSVCTR